MANGFLLDSDICIYLLKNLSARLAERTREQEEGTLFVSAVSIAEVGLGVRERLGEEAAFRRFVSDVTILPFDDKAAHRYTALPFRRGKFDRLIAAHALATGLTLVTNNEADFVDIPDLVIENWTL
jgi:tRNA(fMet)-specific endonuclease VapC